MTGKEGDFREIYFSMFISADEYLQYYRGTAKNVVVQAWDGRTIQFPASSLQPFVEHEGIRGSFVIRFDGQNRLISLRRMS